MVIVVCFAAIAVPAYAQDCESLAKQKYDKVTITAAAFMNDPAGFVAPKTPGQFGTRLAAGDSAVLLS
jgi:hypothetical protein